MARIELNSLVKAFGRFRAVDGVDLDIADGEFVVLVGPSGCGKTTTLNMISGLERPTSGTVRIDGRVMNDVEPGDRGLGMVFQSLALFPHMTVFENIAFGLRIQRVPPVPLRSRVEEVARTMRIHPLLPKKPGLLSGGEAQRVALARTLVTNPSAFLMDEPLSSLDAKLRVEMRTELKRLHTTLGSTFVYVTHDQAEAMTMADRVVVMRDGRIQQIGDPLTIYQNPANRFVAGFFGVPAMNFIRGVLEGRGEGLVFRSKNLTWRVPAARAAGAAGRSVYLGVRPENLVLSAGAASGEVALIEPLGDQTLVFVEYGGEAGAVVTKVDANDPIRPGDRVEFSFHPAGVLLFDGETDERIRLA